MQVHVRLEHEWRGRLTLHLYSPSGTHSEILSVRPLDDNSEGLEFTFMTVHNWGEDPRGEWTLSVVDTDRESHHPKVRGKLLSWSLTLWGHVTSEGSAKKRDRSGVQSSEAHEAEEVELKHIMAAEEASSENVRIQDLPSDRAELESLLEVLRKEMDRREYERENPNRQRATHIKSWDLHQKNLNLEGRGLKHNDVEDDAQMSYSDMELLLRALDENSEGINHNDAKSEIHSPQSGNTARHTKKHSGYQQHNAENHATSLKQRLVSKIGELIDVLERQEKRKSRYYN